MFPIPKGTRAKLDCSLLLDVASSKRRAKTVANSKAGIADLLAWCTKQHVTSHERHAILEGTGVYHEQTALALSDAGVTVSIVNPAQVKDFGRSLGIRTKTDGVDSLILARYGALLNPKPWQLPSPEARVLQALLSRREAIAQDLQRERNRLENTRGHKSRCHRNARLDSSIPGGFDYLSGKTTRQTPARHR